ncbi:unnamed protein product [Mesocestoides corti]|uniref:Uncharacterized protein n=2 Tax=Mesocestoides corti TaxID=53468 RepID=A0A3P6GH44_MESCO|nr:unnamed protein product [Mesocestoides corti]
MRSHKHTTATPDSVFHSCECSIAEWKQSFITLVQTTLGKRDHDDSSIQSTSPTQTSPTGNTHPCAPTSSDQPMQNTQLAASAFYQPSHEVNGGVFAPVIDSSSSSQALCPQALGETHVLTHSSSAPPNRSSRGTNVDPNMRWQRRNAVRQFYYPNWETVSNISRQLEELISANDEQNEEVVKDVEKENNSDDSASGIPSVQQSIDAHPTPLSES